MSRLPRGAPRNGEGALNSALDRITQPLPSAEISTQGRDDLDAGAGDGLELLACMLGRELQALAHTALDRLARRRFKVLAAAVDRHCRDVQPTRAGRMSAVADPVCVCEQLALEVKAPMPL